MYVRLKKSKKSKNATIQIVEGLREGKKVKQKIIASLGVASDQTNLNKLLKLAEHLICKLETLGMPIPTKIEVEKIVHSSTVFDGFKRVVNKIMELSGFSKILQDAQNKKSFDLNEVVKLMITQRLDFPSSKLRTFQRQVEHGFSDIDLQHLYRAMDAVEPLSDLIQQQAFTTMKSQRNYKADCFFFDVTTLYFESIQQDDLKDFGYSKDQKFHSVQIVLALVVDKEGIPLAFETFKGDLAETKTLIPVLEKLKKRFDVKNVTVVCDRGLASKANVNALQDLNFHFVIATKLRSISSKFKINDLSKYQPLPNQTNVPEADKILFYTMEHPQYSDTLLIATYSPNRAFKDKQDRERLLEKLQSKLSDSSDEKSLKKMISNSGYRKYTTIGEASGVELNQNAVDLDLQWDGFHGIAVSKSANLSPTEALSRYKDLWHIEESFRIMKSTLGTRPIFHWAPKRINAHVLLCFMTLFVERFLEFLLRQNGTPLTPDKIRYSLSQVHVMQFKDSNSGKVGKMESQLNEDAQRIFQALDLSLERVSSVIPSCCA